MTCPNCCRVVVAGELHACLAPSYYSPTLAAMYEELKRIRELLEKQNAAPSAYEVRPSTKAQKRETR